MRIFRNLRMLRSLRFFRIEYLFWSGGKNIKTLISGNCSEIETNLVGLFPKLTWRTCRTSRRPPGSARCRTAWWSARSPASTRTAPETGSPRPGTAPGSASPRTGRSSPAPSAWRRGSPPPGRHSTRRRSGWCPGSTWWPAACTAWDLRETGCFVSWLFRCCSD